MKKIEFSDNRLMLCRVSIALTLAIAALVVLVSSLGIFVEQTYAKETKSWILQAIGQDIANLVSIPIFLVAAIFTYRGSVRAHMVWIGVLLFLIYAFVIYAFDIHYNSLFLAYVAVLSLSIYAFFSNMTRTTNAIESLKEHFSENTKPRVAVSIFLMIIAILFYFQWLSQDIPATLTNEAPADVREISIPTNPVHVLDLGLFLPAMMIASVLLWKNKPMGYLFSAPLLVFSALTGAGILFSNALIRSNGTPVSFIPDAVVGTVTAISVILAWLYLREVTKKKISSRVQEKQETQNTSKLDQNGLDQASSD